MVKKKKGFLKKLGCILISASILLTGWTFFGSSISIADADTELVEEALTDPTSTDTISDTTTDTTTDTNTGTSTETTVEGTTSTDTSGATDETADADTGEDSETSNATTTFDLSTFQTYSLDEDQLSVSLASTNDDGTYTADDGATYSDSSMTTLVSVPSGIESFTVPSSVTVIEAGAFDGSNVKNLIFEDGTKITSIGTHNSWPNVGSVDDMTYVSALGCSATSVVVSYFQDLQEAGKYIEINFDSSGTVTSFTITYDYLLLAKDGTVLRTESGVSSETVVAGNTPKGITATTYTDANGVEYERVEADDPTLVAATKNTTYTYTWQATTETYTITIAFQLNDSEGNTVATLTDAEDNNIPILSLASGTTPSYEPPTTFTYSGTTYTYNDAGPSPAYTTVSEDTTYTFTFASSASDEEGGGGGSADTKKYSGTIMGNFYESDGTTLIGTKQIGTFSQAAGTTVTAPSQDGYAAFGTTTYTVTATNGQTATFNYKRSTSSSSSSAKKFKVTVYDVFYDQTMQKKIETKTRQVDTYDAGATYSYEPKTYSGYEYVSAENQSGTVNQDRTVTFKYKATTATTKTVTNSKYSIIEGANQKVASNVGTVVIKCDGPIEKIVAIKVDGVTLAQNQFTVQSGSTILTLTASYVASLSAGDHIVRFEYTDGWAETVLTITGKTTTTVTYKVASDGSISSGHTKDTTPTTADGFDTRYLLCIAIFLLGAGTILFSKQKKLEAILAGDRDEE